MSHYQVVSADSHFLEPATLWTEKLDKRFRDRGPRCFTGDDGIVMLTGEDMAPQSISGWCAAGRASVEERAVIDRMGWDAAPEEVWDPARRLKGQDRDGMLAEILYTSFGMVAMNIKDPALAMACMRIFNDYAGEFCAYDPKRLIGVGAVVTDDVSAAVLEIERIRKLGLRGVMLPVTLAAGDSYGDPRLDPVWAACQDNGLVISFHAGTSRAGINPTLAEWPQLYMGVHYLMQRTLTDAIFGGVFDRFPKLRFVSVENDVSWLPHYVYRMDHFVDHFVAHADVSLQRRPSDYINDHFFSTFQFEGPGIDSVRKTLGSTTIMWGNDFPHLDSTWPHSSKVIQESLSDIMPAKDVDNIIYNNVVKLYDLSFTA